MMVWVDFLRERLPYKAAIRADWDSRPGFQSLAAMQGLGTLRSSSSTPWPYKIDVEL